MEKRSEEKKTNEGRKEEKRSESSEEKKKSEGSQGKNKDRGKICGEAAVVVVVRGKPS